MPSEPLPLKELLENFMGPRKEHHTGYTGEMARRLKALGERHREDSVGPHGLECFCGRLWPCPDAEILEGQR